MKPRAFPFFLSYAGGIAIFIGAVWAAVAASLPTVQRLANGEALIQQTTTAGQYYRVEASSDLQSWTPLVTLLSAGLLQHTDAAGPYFPKRFYRIASLTGTPLTGDHFQTSAGEVIIHPVNHASFVMSWSGKMIYVDPVPITPSPYTSLPKADLILVTHNHSDHYNVGTLSAQLNAGGKIVCPNSVYTAGPFAGLVGSAILMKTGQTPSSNNTPPQTVIGLTIEGVPAYNTSGTIYHTLGTCNAYVLTIGDKRIFISGDTGSTPEMRALPNIDAAFVCMNIPFTMDIATAASVVRAFRPRIVFPYHYRNSDNSLADLVSFKQQVGTDLGIEVRSRTWY